MVTSSLMALRNLPSAIWLADSVPKAKQGNAVNPSRQEGVQCLTNPLPRLKEKEVGGSCGTQRWITEAENTSPAGIYRDTSASALCSGTLGCLAWRYFKRHIGGGETREVEGKDKMLLLWRVCSWEGCRRVMNVTEERGRMRGSAEV